MNPSGFAVMKGDELKVGTIRSDEEILELCSRELPDVIAIDAPLSLPRSGGLRMADRLLIGRGYRVLPPGFPGMKHLTLRAIGLSGRLRSEGFRVIEIHPRTSDLVIFTLRSLTEACG